MASQTLEQQVEGLGIAAQEIREQIFLGQEVADGLLYPLAASIIQATLLSYIHDELIGTRAGLELIAARLEEIAATIELSADQISSSMPA